SNHLLPCVHSHAPHSHSSAAHRHLHSFPTRRSSDLSYSCDRASANRRLSPSPSSPWTPEPERHTRVPPRSRQVGRPGSRASSTRSEEHTSELQSRENLVCRLLLEKKKKHKTERMDHQ